jgi:hypothetical protein
MVGYLRTIMENERFEGLFIPDEK